MIRKKFSNIGVVNISQCGSILSPFRSILRPQLLFVAELNCLEYFLKIESCNITLDNSIQGLLTLFNL